MSCHTLCLLRGASIAQRELRLPAKYPIWSRIGSGILAGDQRGMVLLPPYELQMDAGEIRGSGLSPFHRRLISRWSLGNSERLAGNIGHIEAGT